MKAIRITIELISHDGAIRRTLHNDYKTVEKAMTVERTLHWMLGRAQEKFTKPETAGVRMVD